MDLQNLAYALTQVVHNFGAVAVVGGAILGRMQAAASPARSRLAWLVLLGWVLQGASGMGFGIISFAYYGQFPDIHGIAIAALYLKMACAGGGVLLAAVLLRHPRDWPARRRKALWTVLILLGITALTAAAFLRWFS